MPVYDVEGTAAVGYVEGLVPDVAAELSSGALGSRANVEAEVDVCLSALRNCWQAEPDQVMLIVSAISSRCTELCIHLHRVEGRREYVKIRTMQVERVLAECDRQWKTASRLLEMRRQDLEMAR